MELGNAVQLHVRSQRSDRARELRGSGPRGRIRGDDTLLGLLDRAQGETWQSHSLGLWK
jgi:hypothetical protein